MDATERDEVRKMIAGVLGGWHSDTVLRETNTEKALNKIENHLGTVNGTILKHNKELEDGRLAIKTHVIECPVAKEVKNIDKKVNAIVTINKTRALDAIKVRGNTTLYLMAIGIIVSILLGCVGILKTNKVQTTTSNTDDKVNNINTPVKDVRSGKIYLYPAGLLIDSLRKMDSLKYEL